MNSRGHDAVYEAELNDKREVVEWVLKEGGEGLEEGVSGKTEDNVEDMLMDEGCADEPNKEHAELGKDLKDLDIKEDTTSD